MLDNGDAPPSHADKSAAAEPDKQTRERSEVAFPYSDIQNAVDMCRKLQEKAGTSCELAQLAAWLGQSAAGGTFRSRLAAAKLFGFIEVAQARVSLTTLGRDVIDSARCARAMAEGFLRVPLYQMMYKEYEGYTLPPAAAIERQMVQFGVPVKQKERARQTFVKSAQNAGYIDRDTGKFIRPASAPPTPELQDNVSERSSDGGTGRGGGIGGGDYLDLDPLLIALLKKIPTKGEPWPEMPRVRWFRTFAMNVSQVYDEEDAAVDLEIKSVNASDANRS